MSEVLGPKIKDVFKESSFKEIPVLKAVRRTVEELIRDELTGLPQIKALKLELQSLLNRGERKLALLMTDFGRLKEINEGYGWAVGTEALRHLASVIKKSKREDVKPHPVRYGGDEFAILISGLEKEAVKRYLEDLKKTISESPFEHEGQKIDLRVHFGVALYEEGETLDSFLKKAEKSLEEAKKKDEPA